MGYVITDKSSNLYKFRKIHDAALCASRCNALGQLGEISLYMGNGTLRFEEDITFEELLDKWVERLSPKHESFSIEQDFQKHFSRKYPLFRL